MKTHWKIARDYKNNRHKFESVCVQINVLIQLAAPLLAELSK